MTDDTQQSGSKSFRRGFLKTMFRRTKAPTPSSPGLGSTISNFNSATHTGVANFGPNYGTIINVQSPSAVARTDVPLEDIVEWLKAPSFSGIRKAALEQQMPGTGTWFLETEEFKQLLNGESVIVWGTGLPGAGKTILSALSTKRLQEECESEPGVVLVYAFLRYIEKHTTRDVLAALVAQMIRSDDGALSHLQALHHRCKREGEESLTERDLAIALREMASRLRRLYIIIDGLDEAVESTKEGLLRALTSLSRASILVMSRPLPHLTDMCTPHALRVPIQARTDDIGAYIKARAEESPRMRAIIGDDHGALKQLCTRVKAQSDGMFLLARIQMDILERGPNTLDGLFKVLDTLPSGIDAMYERSLQRINEQSPEDAALAKRVFLWLLHAISDDPLSLDDFRTAVSVEVLDVVPGPNPQNALPPISLLLSACCGMVEVCELEHWGQLKTTIKFIHYTIKEFLLQRIAWLGNGDPHMQLSVTCLSWMMAQESSLHEALEEGQSFTQARSEPFLCYAVRNWGIYARLSCDKGNPLQPLIRAVLTRMANRAAVPMDLWPVGSSPVGMSALHLAVFFELQEVILDWNLPFLPDPSVGWTPFHVAATEDLVAPFRALLAGGYRHHYPSLTMDGDTPLDLALQAERGRICEEILSPSSPSFEAVHPFLDLNARKSNGETPLIMACMWKYSSQGALLLLNHHPEIDINVQDNKGRTALMLAFRAWRSEAFTILLAKDNLNGSLCDNDGRSSLTYLMLSSAYNRKEDDEGTRGGWRGLLARGGWTISNICRSIIDFLDRWLEWDRLRRRTLQLPYQLNQHLSALLELEGFLETKKITRAATVADRDDEAEEHDFASVLLHASQVKCRKCVPLVIGYLRGRMPTILDFHCGCAFHSSVS